MSEAIRRSGESNIDELLESLMKWATTGRIVEDVYFWIRYQCFCLAAVICPSRLPLTREAERELKQHDKHLRPPYTRIERMGEGLRLPTIIFMSPLLLTIVAASIIPMPLLTAPSLHDSAVAQVYAENEAQQEEPTITLTGYLKITATVLAALSGLLLTVVALAINVTASSLVGAGFLLSTVVRKRGFIPAASLLLGTVFAALTGIVLSNRIGFECLNGWTLTVALLGLICVFLLLTLLLKTLQTLGASELERLLLSDSLILLRKSLRSKLRQSLIQSKFG